MCELLGGRFGDSFHLYRAISQDHPDRMAASVRRYFDEGYQKFQLKVGGAPMVDVDRIRAVREVLDSLVSAVLVLHQIYACIHIL